MSNQKLQMAELVNGRAAMVGCSALALVCLGLKVNLGEVAFSQNFQAIWWSLGVYAGQ